MSSAIRCGRRPCDLAAQVKWGGVNRTELPSSLADLRFPRLSKVPKMRQPLIKRGAAAPPSENQGEE